MSASRSGPAHRRRAGARVASERPQRKLAAILAADVVGYSRLAGLDEDSILARLRTLRNDLIDPAIAVHRGRVVKRTGDGAIVEFRSVVDAVNCSVEIQKAMPERNAGIPQDRWIVSASASTSEMWSRKTTAI
jgi:class 3 adenylate cyclase